MAHGQKSDEKVVFVGDSRVRVKTTEHIPQDYSAYPGRSEAFVPNFLLKEWMVGVVVLVGFLALTIAEGPPLGYPANPTNTGFIPMPDWYFLFLYQLLKYPYTSGHFVVLGTVGLPGILFGSLIIAPFLDSGKERRFYRRPIASALMFLSIISIVYLTIISWSHYQGELKAKNIIPEDVKREEAVRDARKAGKEPPNPVNTTVIAPIVLPNDPAATIYSRATCIACHGTDMKGNANGGIPPLRGVGDLHTKDEILAIIKNGRGVMPAQYQINIDKGLTAAEINTLADWLSKQKKAQ